MEGPHISPEDGPRGAHPSEHIRPPDVEEFKRWQDAAEGNVRLITVSPEWDQTPVYISELVRTGVVASIGHTKATARPDPSGDRAPERPCRRTWATRRIPLCRKRRTTSGINWREDRLTASFIVDGIHIPGSLSSAPRSRQGRGQVGSGDRRCDAGDVRSGAVSSLGRSTWSCRRTAALSCAAERAWPVPALRMDRAIGNSVRMAKHFVDATPDDGHGECGARGADCGTPARS